MQRPFAPRRAVRAKEGREGSLYRRHEELTATQIAYCRSVGCVLLADAREEGSGKERGRERELGSLGTDRRQIYRVHIHDFGYISINYKLNFLTLEPQTQSAQSKLDSCWTEAE